MAQSLEQWVNRLVWAAAIAVLLLIPLKIIGLGFLPEDDALRHAAKAVSGKDWGDILVLRDGLMADHNPGWHQFLGLVHRFTGGDTEFLVIFSIGLLFVIVAWAGLPWLARPEAWLAALAIMAAATPQLALRLTLGRPFLLTVAVVITLLFWWQRPGMERASPAVMIVSSVMIAVAVWLHGTWYLFALLPAAFAISGRWREAWLLGVCCAAGSVLGACLTGHPWEFLTNALAVLFNVLAPHELQRTQVRELMALEVDFHALVVVALLLLARLASGRWEPGKIFNPAFFLMCLGWLLSLKYARFWLDWGLPAALVWVAVEIQDYFGRFLALERPLRLAWVGGLAAVVWLLFTSDVNGRWTNNLATEYLTPESPGAAGWLPEPGGIVYTADQAVFYNTFFKNPKAPWKYILGFAPTFMPPEDLAIYRRIQFNGAVEAYRQWVKKMRPQDRFMMRGAYPGRPPIPELEWRLVSGTWIGRLPKPKAEPER